MLFDAGYDLTRLAWLLRDIPVEVLGRLRADRVLYFPPPRTPGRAARHGAAFRLASERSRPAAQPRPRARSRRAALSARADSA